MTTQKEPRYCVQCGDVLTGKQQKYCDDVCQFLYKSRTNETAEYERRMAELNAILRECDTHGISYGQWQARHNPALKLQAAPPTRRPCSRFCAADSDSAFANKHTPAVQAAAGGTTNHNLEDTFMANNTKTTAQRIETLPLNLVTAAEYQRETNTLQVERIANNFSPAKLGIPVVSERDGNYYIIDGAHRVAALRRMKYATAKFIVLEGLTYEDEADYFRKQHENTRRLSLYSRYKAGIGGGR